MPYNDGTLRTDSELRANAAIPDAWIDLVNNREWSIFASLSAAVEARTGLRPDPAQVAIFLKGLANPSYVEAVRTSETHPGFGGPSIFPPPLGKVTEG